MASKFEIKLANYIIEQVNAGYKLSEIKKFLLQEGYNKQTVDKALEIALDKIHGFEVE